MTSDLTDQLKREIAAQLGFDPKNPPVSVDDKQAGDAHRLLSRYIHLPRTKKPRTESLKRGFFMPVRKAPFLGDGQTHGGNVIDR